MAHRLQVAGGSIELFTPEAIDMIASASGGVPRNINMIGFNSLTLAYALEKQRVGSDEVAEVLRDLALPVSEPQPQLAAQAVLERSPAFAQTAGPSRLVWIAAGVALLAAGTFLLGRF
jgi:hypothetical protein